MAIAIVGIDLGKNSCSVAALDENGAVVLRRRVSRWGSATSTALREGARQNDDRDAEAIAEAATRPTMRFIAMKAEAQLDMQTLHRARSRLVNSRIGYAQDQTETSVLFELIARRYETRSLAIAANQPGTASSPTRTSPSPRSTGSSTTRPSSR